MGIFSDWSIFQKPEAVLERQLQANAYHPFQLVTDEAEHMEQVFVYSARHGRFYFYLLSAIASLLFAVIWHSTDGDGEYLVFAVIVLVLSIYLCIDSWPRWSVVLEPACQHYSVYHGDRLVASQHCHNIYVRLACKRTGSRSPSYQLVLDGWGLLDTIHLTRHTTNRKKLRQLAQELTSHLKINYFDVHNISKHHIIRHNRPFTHNTQPAATDTHEE